MFLFIFGGSTEEKSKVRFDSLSFHSIHCSFNLNELLTKVGCMKLSSKAVTPIPSTYDKDNITLYLGGKGHCVNVIKFRILRYGRPY